MQYIAPRAILIPSSLDWRAHERLRDPGICPLCPEGRLGRRDAPAGGGGGVFKQRVARDGGGKSGGFRTIILFRIGGHCFFAHGFAKNTKANVSAKEIKALKRLAELLLRYSGAELRTAEAAGELIEVVSHGDDKEAS